jgi:hypothetical protein
VIGSKGSSCELKVRWARKVWGKLRIELRNFCANTELCKMSMVRRPRPLGPKVVNTLTFETIQSETHSNLEILVEINE